MTDNLNLSLWVARRAEQGTLQAHSDYVAKEIAELEAKLAKAAAFVHDFACRAKMDEHTQDEMWLIDEDSLRYQRDCDITQARTTLAELKGQDDE